MGTKIEIFIDRYILDTYHKCLLVAIHAMVLEK